MKSYKRLILLKMTHDYFPDKECNVLRLKPTTNTVELMQRYNILIRSIQSDNELLIEEGLNLADRLDYIQIATGLEGFTFDLVVEDSDFYTYTTLPENWNGTLIYSNQNKDGEHLTPKFLEEISGPFGQIKFFFSNLIEDSGATYTIAFKARETIWSYYLINRSEMPLGNAYVKTSGTVSFTGPQDAVLTNGEKAFEFTSEEAIPLVQKSKIKYDLVKRSEKTNMTGGKTIFKGLPLASPKNTQPSKNNEEVTFTSSIYIYI